MSTNLLQQNQSEVQPQSQRQPCFSDIDFIPYQTDPKQFSYKKTIIIFVAVMAAIAWFAVYCLNSQIEQYTSSYSIYDEALVAAQADVPQYLSYFYNAEVYDAAYENYYDPAVVPNFEKADYDFDAAVLEALKGGRND